MTPDELRRMDNDDCIIFEKGVKPVRAKKFYYFKHPMARDMKQFEISHNDIGEIDRGTWRKYNPYNPYVEEDKQATKKDLKVESLDDLFEDDTKDQNNNTKNSNIVTENKEKSNNNINSQSNMQDSIILPQGEEEDDDELFSIDVQKELEAKFDELFGPIDEG